MATSIWKRVYLDRNDGGLGRIFWHAEGENQPARPVDLQIFTAMLDIFFAASIGDSEPATDFRIDFATHDGAVLGRE